VGHRHVLSIAAAAIGFAVLFAIGGFFLAPCNAAIPAALAFAVVGMLGGASARTFKDQDERIRRLERRLSDESR